MYLLGEYEFGAEIIGFFNNFDEARERIMNLCQYELEDEKELVFEKTKFGGYKEVDIYDFKANASYSLFIVRL